MGEEQVNLEAVQREFNISSVQKNARKQARNVEYDVKAVAQGRMNKLLMLTNTLPDVNKFHDKDETSIDISSNIAWDDLTGMTLEAGKVKEARTKELEYISRNEFGRRFQGQLHTLGDGKLYKQGGLM